jgi:sugar lactone lactonase YvrE
MTFNTKLLAGALALVLVAGMTSPAFAGVPIDTMYGSTGNNVNEQTPNPGSLVIIDQFDGSQTFIGDPTISGGVSGLAFDDSGRLWGTNVNQNPAILIEIDPNDGSLLDVVGTVTLPTGQELKVNDLGFDPILKELWGTSNDVDGDDALLKIDRTTAQAVEWENIDFAGPGSIGFAPDGTLYAVDRSPSGSLFTIDPVTGNILTQVDRSIDIELDALGVRSDGTIFASYTAFEELGSTVVTIDTDGTVTEIGAGEDTISDIAFRLQTQDKQVAGELLPLDSTALMIAGLSSMSVFMIPAVAGIAGAAVYLVKYRANKE